MVKSELIESLAERSDITIAKAEEVVELFFDSIIETLCKGDRVEIRGFGALTVPLPNQGRVRPTNLLCTWSACVGMLLLVSTISCTVYSGICTRSGRLSVLLCRYLSMVCS